MLRQASRWVRQPAGDPFDDGLSIVVNLDSELGPAHFVFTRRDHCHAVSGYAHATADLGNNHPGLVLNGVTRCGGVHLYPPSWELKPHESQATWQCRPGGPEQPRKLVVRALTRAVASFVADHPEVPAAAELRDLLNDRTSALRELAEAGKTLADIEAGIELLSSRIEAVEAELERY